MNEKHIIKIKGQDFIKFAGLMDLAHEKGLKEIKIINSIIDWEKKTASTIVEVELKDGLSCQALGTASQDNCGSMVREHFGEMSHTRAVGRALRWLLNVSETCFEELGGVVEDVVQGDSGLKVEVPLVCSSCNKVISVAEGDFSIKWFGKTLCRSCQGKFKKGE